MNKVHVYNRVSGVVGAVPENHLNHPVLGANLEKVRNGKRRGRMSDLINDAPKKASATRMVEPAIPDKDKED